MRAADIAMYRAKSSGGGQHCLFNDELAAEHQQKVETEKALTEAVQRGEFVLAFQPQMSLVTGEVAGAEALLRWNHPRDGLRMPGTFIPDRRADRRHRRDRRLGDGRSRRRCSATGTATASTAGSPSTSARARSTAPISSPGCARRSPTPSVPLSLIELEFTESAAMEVSDDGARRDRARCAPTARRIAIDDFGTGYSNLARLRAMPLDRVKLDPSLIADIETCEKARVIVQAVIQLIKGVGCEIVAEAVETVAQADILRAMGCDTVQGYRLRPADVRGRVPRLDRQRRPRRASRSPKPSTFRTIRS